MQESVLEFLTDYYFILVYGIALFFSIAKYRLYYDSVLKYFPIIIAYTLIAEVLGGLIAKNDDLQIVYLEGYSFYNQLIFNIFDFIFFLYFFYVFWKITLNAHYGRLITYGAIAFVVSSIINPFFHGLTLYPQMLASSVGFHCSYRLYTYVF